MNKTRRELNKTLVLTTATIWKIFKPLSHVCVFTSSPRSPTSFHHVQDPTENFHSLDDDFISTQFSPSTAWWRARANRTTNRRLLINPERGEKETQHIFRHNQLILIASKLLFIYGIERRKKRVRKREHRTTKYHRRLSNDFSRLFRYEKRCFRYLHHPTTTIGQCKEKKN